MALATQSFTLNCCLRLDLMTEDVHSIWLDYTPEHGDKIRIGGWYREWLGGDRTAQEAQANAFTKQMEKAASDCANIIITGDFNLDSTKWHDPNYPHTSVAPLIRNQAEHLNLIKWDTDYTFEVLRRQGHEILHIKSTLDHCFATPTTPIKNVCTFPNGLSDHLPLLILLEKQGYTQAYEKVTITKRTWKSFNQGKFLETLINKNWEKLADTEDINLLTQLIEKHIVSALDEHAPWKTFVHNKRFRSDLSDKTKSLLRERDRIRATLRSLSPTERAAARKKYNRLRNQCNRAVKKDARESVQNKVLNVSNRTSELWRIANSTIKGQNKERMELEEDGQIIRDEVTVAEKMND